MDAETKSDDKRVDMMIPQDIIERVEAQAATFRRKYKAEIVVLLEEALNARERRK